MSAKVALKNLDYQSILIALLALFGLSIYLPFLLWGGIIVDDWGDIFTSFHTNSFRENYLAWFPLFSNRPLAPLPIVLTTRLFGLWQYGYIATNVGIYLVMLGLTGRVLLRRVGMTAAVLFFLIAACPIIAPVVIFSPINQLTATISMLFWSLSLTFLDLYLVRPKWYLHFATYLCLLYGFLTYEIILPLTTLTLFLPLVAPEELDRSTSLLKRTERYLLHFVLPVLLVLASAFVWQKLIAPRYMTVYSRLNLGDIHHAIFAASTWFHAVSIDTFRLLLTSLRRPPAVSFVFPLVFLWLALAVLFKKPPQAKPHRGSLLFLAVAALTFFSSASLYFLNGSDAQIGGYDSRGMSSSWLSAALFLACSFDYLQYWVSGQLLRLVLFLFCGIVLHSLCLQRDNYLESWKEQNRILDDVIAQAHAHGFDAGQAVIGDVPYLLKANYNNEIVFSQPWDFGDALSMKSNSFIKSGAVVSKDTDGGRNIKVSDDEILLSGWWKEKISVLLYYRYDPVTGIGTLSKIHDAAELKRNVSALLN